MTVRFRTVFLTVAVICTCLLFNSTRASANTQPVTFAENNGIFVSTFYNFYDYITGNKSTPQQEDKKSDPQLVAQPLIIDFENPLYVVGNINAQNGWSSTGSAPDSPGLDHAVFANNTSAPSSFGAQSLRISNAVTSGSFDQTFSKPLPNEAGEAIAENRGFSSGTRNIRFETEFDLASVIPNAEQLGLSADVSPDRGDGSRMSLLRFNDQSDGIHVVFFDYQDLAPFGSTDNPGDGDGPGGDNFFSTDVATLDRTKSNRIKLVMDFVDGQRNDVVRVFVNGELVHTGTSWEDFYRFNPGQAPSGNQTRTVDSLLFRSRGTAVPANSGNGFLFDNLSLGVANRPTVAVTPASGTFTTSPIPFTFTFSEPVTGFDVSDISVTNGTASDPISTDGGTTYTSDITAAFTSPAFEGTITVSVPDGAATSVAEFTNTASNTASVDFDDPSPTVVSSNRATNAANPTMASSVIFTVTFSELVTGVDPEDFRVTKTGNLGGGTVSTSVCTDSNNRTSCDVTVNGISTTNGNGTVGLNVLDDDTIVDNVNQSLNGGFTGGETYTVLMTATLPANCPTGRVVYDVVSQFSLGGNPNCAYTYGNTSGPASNTVLTYTTPIVGAFNEPGIDGWYTQPFQSGFPLPGVFKNNNGETTNYLTISQAATVLNVHPGQSGERSVVRFTVPMGGAGFYNINGQFIGIDNVGPTTDVLILVNGVSVFSGNVNGFGNAQPFNFPRNLAVGDTVDFSVGYGANASFSNDSTGLAATLTPIATPQAETLYGLSGTTAGSQTLVILDSANPNAATAVGTTTISGLASGETLLGIDFRPATGQLYGLGSTSRLYIIDITSGAATAVGTAGAFTLTGTQFGFDFNPTVDRIRVISNTGQNLRLNPNNGALVAADGAINGGAANTTITAAAYTNNLSNATTTLLYDIDTTNNTLYTQNPPNNGTLATPIPLTGATVGSINGFDISGKTTVAYTSFGNQLYTIDLTSGVVSPVGSIGAFTDFTGLTAAPMDVAPIVRSINRVGNPTNVPTNDSTFQYLVTFSEPVTGVDFADFRINTSDPNISTGVDSIVQGTADPNTYTVTVSITGTPVMGTTIRLDLRDNGSIFDLTTPTPNPLVAADGNADGSFTGQFYIIDQTPPTATINQAAGQNDPTNVSPVNFTVVFSEAVTGFDATDVVITGTAFSTTNPATVTVTGSGTTYNVAVSGMGMGTIIANVPAGAAVDVANNQSAAATFTDNIVTFDNAVPTVTINQGANQPDPTSASPITFTVIFSEPVTDFDDAADVTITGTAFSTSTPAGTPVVVIEPIPGDRATDGSAYNVRVSGMTSSGTVIADVPAGVAIDRLNNPNTASTSTDNTVNFALETLYALTNPSGTPTTQSLITFSSSNPNAASTTTVITGLATGETLVGIDFRPSTLSGAPNRRGILYGIAVASGVGRVYTINTTSGVATSVGIIRLADNSTIAISGTEFGVDFNPVPDRIRVISNTGENLRINPDNGVTAVDASLNPFDTNGTQRTGVSGAAYSNNDNDPTTGTMLFDIDAVNNQLVLQNPPNNGTLTAVGGTLGFDVNEVNGFDISGTTTTAYAAFQTASATDSSLYTIDLTTGKASLVGIIGSATAGSGLTIRGLSAAPPELFVDNNGPTATITQAVGQLDPTNASPINFTVTFSEPVTDFDDATDVTVTGTAFSTTTTPGTPVVEIAPISRDSTVFNVRISGMTSNGTVVLNVPAGAAVDLVGNGNSASDPTVGDNTVTYTRPAISINDVSISEGNSGTKTLDFTVTLSSAITETVTVDYATADEVASSTTNPATAGTDYVSDARTLTFLPTDPLTKTVSITINGDTTVEPNETFLVNLSNNSSNSTIGDASGVGTINNDDVEISFSSATYSVTEGTPTATITVNRNGVTPDDVTVNYATSDGSAGASDYTTASGTLTFSSTETSETFTVAITDDLLSETPETVNLTLSNVSSNAVLVTPSTATLTITDNDGGGLVSISGTITQGGVGLNGVTVNLSGSSTATTTTANINGVDGRYTFTGLNGNANNPNNSYLVRPTASGLVFDPSERSYVSLGMSVSNANFTAFTVIPRNLRVVNTYQPTLATSTVTVPIVLDSLGNENALSFSLNYNPAKLTNPIVACGSDAVGCSFTPNTDTPGQLGIEFTRADDATTTPPTPTVFAAGIGRQVVTVTFTATPGTFVSPSATPNAAFNDEITFTDSPTTSDINDVDGNTLLFNEVSGFVIFAQGFEGDVAGRNTGSGALTGGDITVLRAFVSGTTPTDPTFNEFQRADVAPAGTKGGGTLTSADVTVLRNYIANTILTPAGGPTQPTTGSSSFIGSTEKSGSKASAIAAAGDIRVVNVAGTRNSKVIVPITLESNGTENGFSFSLNFEQAKLSNPVITLGSDVPPTSSGSLITPNVTQVANGRLGITVNLPENQTLVAGVRQIVNVTFDINMNAPLGTSPITFGNTPQAQDLNNNAGDSLPTNFINGSVNISNTTTAAGATVGGRVTTSNGKGLVGAIVSMTDANGVIRATRTTLGGRYQFADVSTGATYVVSATSKRFRFEEQAKSITGDTNDVNFTAMP